jgi:hypothetical protein
MSSCKVEDDDFIPCGSIETALKYGAINCCKLFSESLVIGDEPEMVIDFCPFCAEQV